MEDALEPRGSSSLLSQGGIPAGAVQEPPGSVVSKNSVYREVVLKIVQMYRKHVFAPETLSSLVFTVSQSN